MHISLPGLAYATALKLRELLRTLDFSELDLSSFYDIVCDFIYWSGLFISSNSTVARIFGDKLLADWANFSSLKSI